MKKLLSFIIVVLIILFVLLNRNKIISSDSSPQETNKLQVVTSLFPLYDFTRQIGGDYLEVSLLLPPGIEPHAFEPKPNDLLQINQADLFIFTGKFMEPWVDDLAQGLDNRNLILVDTSQGINLLSPTSLSSPAHTSSLDPHIWLDFDNAAIMINNITTALIAKDPDHATIYQQNSLSYLNQIKQLDNQFSQTLSTCPNKTFVYAGHYAFGYLAQRYHLNYFAAQGLSPDAEPTAANLALLINQVKTQKLSAIFYEELESPKIAQTLAAETEVKLLLLNPAANLSQQAFEQNETYLSILSQNLANLKIGLNCP